MSRPLTRRDFMRDSACAAVGFAAGVSSLQTEKTRVILIRHKDVLDAKSKINPDILQQMLDEAVTSLLEENDPVKAFGKLVKPGEFVGIKSNNWQYLPTPPELVSAIQRRVTEVGVPEDHISVDDYGVKENPIFLKANSLINARPLRTHYLAGVSGCIKNYIMFGKTQPEYHPNNCANLGALFNLPQVKGKTRLNVLCALTPQFHGRGPHHFSRRFVWGYHGLIVGQDPVAVDTIGLRLIMAKRTEVLGKAQALPPVPKHIEIADTKHGIGTSDINKIELIKLGWNKDILI